MSVAPVDTRREQEASGSGEDEEDDLGSFSDGEHAEDSGGEGSDGEMKRVQSLTQLSQAGGGNGDSRPQQADAGNSTVKTSDGSAGAKGGKKKKKTKRSRLNKIRRQKKKITESNSFEGPEKVMEVRFKPMPLPASWQPTSTTTTTTTSPDTKSPTSPSSPLSSSSSTSSLPALVADPTINPRSLPESRITRSGLRLISRPEWERMLALVQCRVLSVISNEHQDAYLLSESSLFVTPHSVVLKTCGRTLLLQAVNELIRLAAQVGLTVIENFFYTRKNFFFPSRQLFPYTSWKEEVKFLDAIFSHGSAYILGKLNGDHWYMYMTEMAGETPAPVGADQTLEIMMTDLDEAKMAQFYNTDGKASAAAVTTASGIAALFPDALIDDFLFTPCGYSMNGLLGEGYFTIHITPQPHCSYVSFETNLASADYTALVTAVLAVFQPRNFTLLFYESTAVVAGGEGGSAGGAGAVVAGSGRTVDAAFAGIEGCVRSQDVDVEFESYKVAFCHYNRIKK